MPANPALSPAEAALSGAVAGLTSRFVIAPFDVVKIRLQLQSQRSGIRERSSAIKYHSIAGSMATIVREESIRGLWKGNLAAEYLYMSYAALQFSSFNALSLCLSTTAPTLSETTRQFFAGAGAGTLATCVTYPLDLLRTRMASQGQIQVYRSLTHAIAEIYRSEGARGYYRGLVSAVLQIVPYMGLTFASYGHCKRSVNHVQAMRENPGVRDAMCGALAGAISKVGIHPLDTIRKRLQVQGPTINQYVVPRVPVYSSIPHAFRDILRREGALGLYKGLWPSLLKTAPSTAVTFAVYEWMHRWIMERKSAA